MHACFVSSDSATSWPISFNQSSVALFAILFVEAAAVLVYTFSRLFDTAVSVPTFVVVIRASLHAPLYASLPAVLSFSACFVCRAAIRLVQPRVATPGISRATLIWTVPTMLRNCEKTGARPNPDGTPCLHYKTRGYLQFEVARKRRLDQDRQTEHRFLSSSSPFSSPLPAFVYCGRRRRSVSSAQSFQESHRCS